MFKGELYRSKSNPFRIKIVGISSDKVKVRKLTDDDLEAGGVTHFNYHDLMTRIESGEWQLDYK